MYFAWILTGHYLQISCAFDKMISIWINFLNTYSASTIQEHPSVLLILSYFKYLNKSLRIDTYVYLDILEQTLENICIKNKWNCTSK